ncbi:hypothetical protein BC628DRAFT_303551 [Trametes gibbosa]|nr:hypothetical protein BC628DRAFT_303551 [Trametes gibbosa]
MYIYTVYPVRARSLSTSLSTSLPPALARAWAWAWGCPEKRLPLTRTSPYTLARGVFPPEGSGLGSQRGKRGKGKGGGEGRPWNLISRERANLACGCGSVLQNVSRALGGMLSEVRSSARGGERPGRLRLSLSILLVSTSGPNSDLYAPTMHMTVARTGR